jgi:hypothetical protein
MSIFLQTSLEPELVSLRQTLQRPIAATERNNCFYLLSHDVKDGIICM